MGARYAWELWKMNELGPCLKWPKAGDMAGALKPMGKGMELRHVTSSPEASVSHSVQWVIG